MQYPIFARLLFCIPGRMLYSLHKIIAVSSILFLWSFLVFVASPFLFELHHSPISPSSSFQLHSCCSNYFKLIRALIAGRCFSGGQVPGGASPVTHSIPALCAVPPPCNAVFRCQDSPVVPATLQHNWITSGVVVLQFCRNCWATCPDYWFTATPLLKTYFGHNSRAPTGHPYGRIEELTLRRLTTYIYIYIRHIEPLTSRRCILYI
jgi:hypothetical protein